MRQTILAIILGILAGLWEITVQPFLPARLAICPILPITILYLVSQNAKNAYAFALSGAVFLDLFSARPFDAALLRYAVIIALLNFIASRLLTNRSLYAALGLTIAGRILEQASGWIIGTLFYWFGKSSAPWAASAPFGWLLLCDVVFVSIGFVLLARASRQFHQSISPAPHSWET
ncbi:MAG TPA: hypothetical protein VFQ60_02130 [Patescibacteria group bacterium]|nr:hypothetical protein [Patescibacteria group bacterium]